MAASDPKTARININEQTPAKRNSCGRHNLGGRASMVMMETVDTRMSRMVVDALAMMSRTPIIQICLASAEMA